VPSDDTRRILKLFGVAVTNLEDAATPEERARADAELAERLREVQDLIARLRQTPRNEAESAVSQARRKPGVAGDEGAGKTA
jgi:hypothetical protein